MNRNMAIALFVTVIFFSQQSIYSKNIVKFKAGSAPIVATKFSDTGNVLYSASSNGIIQRWSLDSSKLLWSYDVSNYGARKERNVISRITCLNHSIDESMLAFGYCNESFAEGNSDNLSFSIGILEVNSGKLIAVFNGHRGLINDLEFSSNGEYVVSVSSDNTCRLWSLKTKKESLSIALPGLGHRVAITTDMKHIAVSTQNIGGPNPPRIIFQYSCDGVLELQLPYVVNVVNRLFYNPDGSLLCIAGDNRVVLWDVLQQRIVEQYGEICQLGIKYCALSSDWTSIVVIGTFNNKPFLTLQSLNNLTHVYSGGQSTATPINIKHKQNKRIDLRERHNISSVSAIDVDKNAAKIAMGTENGEIYIEILEQK